MRFVVDPKIFDLFPGMQIAVAMARGLDNTRPRVGVDSAWDRAWAGARDAATLGNAQSHPRVAPWRERMRAVGVSGKQFPSSIEATLRRALKGGEPFRINPLVDFYNSISLKHCVPAGGFDLDAIGDPLELRLSREGDTFRALDEEIPEVIAPCEVAYASGTTILTRHFVWRQARQGLITESTRTVLLISEVLAEVSDDTTVEVLDEFRSGLRAYFEVTCESTILSASEPSIAWE